MTPNLQLRRQAGARGAGDQEKNVTLKPNRDRPVRGTPSLANLPIPRQHIVWASAHCCVPETLKNADICEICSRCARGLRCEIRAPDPLQRLESAYGICRRAERKGRQSYPAISASQTKKTFSDRNLLELAPYPVSVEIDWLQPKHPGSLCTPAITATKQWSRC